MLEEFESVAGGSLILHVVDPLPFSEEEDRATQYGIQPVNLGNETIYFGLAGTSSVGEEAVIEFLQPDQESFLEYDLAKLIYSLANPDKVVVGLLAGVSMNAGFDPRTQQMTQPWVVTEQARQLFEVRSLPASFERVDEDIDILWLVQPKDLDDQTLYAIDQFVLGGGKALVFVDPLVEIDAAMSDPASMGGAAGHSLGRLFDAWGVQFSSSAVVADNTYALTITGGFGGRPVRHLGILGIDQSSIDQEDVVTGGLRSINFSTAGHFSVAGASGATLAPIITTSADAAVMPAEEFQFLPDPQSLLDSFTPSGERYQLAARLQGPLKSAFPEGPPPEEAAASGEESQADQEPNEQQSVEGDTNSADPHRAQTDNANVILVGDVDMLSDRLWVQTQSFLGQQLRTAFANNGDFVVNALDNLSGSSDLIGIRSRASFSRPFTTVDELRREADARFRQTEQRLQTELAETERKLTELQASREDQGDVLMSPEQQAEIRRFMDEQVRIRQDLRTVQRELDLSIERLGTVLRAVNIGLVPVLLTVFALGIAALQRRRRRAARR
jgi:ABC-type uncharacterized transport system involved in gliding motility auxiliary subunit